MEKWRIKKGDTVQVITGKDKGKSGEIIEVLRDERRVKVKGLNIVTKHKRPSQMSAGGIERVEAAIHASNVMVLDPKDNKPTRVGYNISKDGTKTRVARRSGEVLDKK
ncbi:MAG: 50S ribosomal protein L24 [Alphaproteobacteria bacterium]|nr:50S ribosomal protein L24 [Alphaproteobacteria bacterium]